MFPQYETSSTLSLVFRLRKQQEAEEADREERERLEQERKKRLAEEKERKAKEEYQRKLEEMKRKQIEEEARRMGRRQTRDITNNSNYIEGKKLTPCFFLDSNVRIYICED